jgi:hypothetical protein
MYSSLLITFFHVRGTSGSSFLSDCDRTALLSGNASAISTVNTRPTVTSQPFFIARPPLSCTSGDLTVPMENTAGRKKSGRGVDVFRAAASPFSQS